MSDGNVTHVDFHAPRLLTGTVDSNKLALFLRKALYDLCPDCRPDAQGKGGWPCSTHATPEEFYE